MRRLKSHPPSSRRITLTAAVGFGAGSGVIAHSEVSRHGPFPSHEAAVKAARRKRDTLLEFDADDAEDAAKLAGTHHHPNTTRQRISLSPNTPQLSLGRLAWFGG